MPPKSTEVQVGSTTVDTVTKVNTLTYLLNTILASAYKNPKLTELVDTTVDKLTKLVTAI